MPSHLDGKQQGVPSVTFQLKLSVKFKIQIHVVQNSENGQLRSFTWIIVGLNIEGIFQKVCNK